MNNKYKTLLKDTGIFAIGSFGSKLLLFLLVPFYTNVLSTKQYGTAELVFTVSHLIVPIFTLSIHTAVLRFGMAKDEKKENAFLVSVFIWIVSSLILIFLIPLTSFYDAIAEWKWYLYFSIITCDGTTIALDYLKVKNKNKYYALISIIQTAILAISNIVFLVAFKKGISGYLISHILAHVFALVLAFCFGGFYSDLKSAKFDRQLFVKMIIFSLPLVVNDISWWFINSSNKVLVEVLLNVSALGIYTVAIKIPSLINLVTSIFVQAWGISSIKEVESSNDKTFFKNVFELYSFVLCAACVFLVSIIKPFMSIYVGESFVSAWKYVPLLLCGACFYAISSYFGSLYSALKRTFNSMTTTLVAALINIVISYFGIKFFGIWGAVIGTFVSYIFIAFLRIFDIRKYMKFEIRWKTFLVNVLLILVQAVLVSLNWHMYLVSTVIVICFVLNNISQIKSLKNKAEF